MEKLSHDVKDVRLLIATGPGNGSRKRIERKAAVVLFAASWEAFIEDLAEASFKFLLKNSPTHEKIPSAVKSVSVEKLRSSNDPRDVWQLAGRGWKKVLKDHGHKCIEKFVQKMNTPDTKNIDAMFLSLIGMKDLSQNWSWRGSPPKYARKKLENFLRLRGQIAHRVATDEAISSQMVSAHVDFIFRLAVTSHNAVRSHLLRVTKKDPWNTYSFGSTR